ncbi:MAG: hypothetical protein EOP50_20355 [Sphingobacteriales bacterium]|nr:MAG: hypothetical protein EOP50_20355 [Sphingobacteriales bacterium]
MKPPKNFIEYMRRRLLEDKEVLKHGTWRKYDGFVERFAAWRPELPFSQVDARLLRLYEGNERKAGNTDNTLNKKMGYLLRQAFAAAGDKLIDPEKLKGYNAPGETETTPTYLTKVEVEALEKFRKKTKNDTLRKITDWFLLACYSGLRYSDVHAFRPDMIKGNTASLQMVKTGHWVEVPLHPRLEAVLRRMEPGVYSNQKFNDYLKVIADAVGIEKNLTTHVGRHTYAVTFLNADGTKIETLQELLGQKSMRSTKVYARITSDRKAEEIARVWK